MLKGNVYMASSTDLLFSQLQTYSFLGLCQDTSFIVEDTSLLSCAASVPHGLPYRTATLF